MYCVDSIFCFRCHFWTLSRTPIWLLSQRTEVYRLQICLWWFKTLW